MLGPNVAWCLAVAAVLFGIGALGVLIRRNTLVVLLSLELMLNAGNLALIALSRHWGNGAGQIFALAVMAVAASEVCVGLGLVVALTGGTSRSTSTRSRSCAEDAAVSTYGSWLCLLAPLGGTILITLLGTRIPRVAAAWIATTSVFVAFGGAISAYFGVHSAHQAQCLGTLPCNLPRGEYTTAWTWLAAGHFSVPLQLLVDPLSSMMMLIVSGVGGLIVVYSIGYMDGDEEERRYFAYIAFFVFSMLLLVVAGNLLILLVGWGLVGLSSYLLIGFWHDARAPWRRRRRRS